MAWGLLAFVAGLLYGWLSPGRQDKGRMMVTGIVYGVIIAAVLGLLGWLLGSNPLFLGAGSSFLGIVVAVVILTVLFVVGVWLGDLAEGRKAGRST